MTLPHPAPLLPRGRAGKWRVRQVHPTIRRSILPAIRFSKATAVGHGAVFVYFAARRGRSPMMNEPTMNTAQKALQINLDATKYGTFAEIGAGQEVARWFFRVGGAAGTVAKTISAYDMAVSDAIYGPDGPVRQPPAAAGDAGLRVRPAAAAAGPDARRQIHLFRFRRHGGDAQFFPSNRRPGLAGHEVSDRAARAPFGNHHPRADAGPGKCPRAGGARHHRRESDSRRVLSSCRTGRN